MTEPRTTPWVGNLTDMTEYAAGGIVSKTVVDEPRVKVVHFAMSAGHSLSEHTANMPASSTCSRASRRCSSATNGTTPLPAPTSTCRGED